MEKILRISLETIQENSSQSSDSIHLVSINSVDECPHD